MIHPVDYAPSQAFGDNPTKSLPASSWIIQTFGNYQPDGHSGVDYPCPVGTQVRAVADGVVLHVGWMGGSYADNPWWIQPSFAGYLYVVDHGHFIGIYGHCKDASNWVNVGDRVKEGQSLGLSGNTGASTGPHLHFEVLPDGYNLYGPMYGRIDPAKLIGSLSYASSESVKPLEDELSAQEVDQIVAETNKQAEETRKQIKEAIRLAVGQVAENDQAMEDVTRAYLKDRITEVGPAALAGQINAAGLAEAVRDELVKLIGGAK